MLTEPPPIVWHALRRLRLPVPLGSYFLQPLNECQGLTLGQPVN